MVKDYAIVYNPKAGKKKKLDQSLELASKILNSLNVSHELFKTEFGGHAIELAEQLAQDGYTVIGAGGDGTCNEVMNGVINSSTGIPCGFIPMGSGNDIPGSIGIRPDIKRACEIISEGRSGKADLGLATTHEGTKRYFLGIGSQGFDAEVTKRFNEGRKNYVYQVFKAIFPWKNRRVKITMDSDVYEDYANLVAVANGPSYGGWMYICQKARVNDGLFHVNIVNIGKFKLIMDLNKTYSATLLPHPNVSEFISKKVKIEMVDPNNDPYLCQVDGEVLGTIPVEYRLIENGYVFIRPEVDEVAEAFKAKHGRYFYECGED